MPVTHRGRRHQLLLYTYMIDRWRRAILAIGIVLLALVGGLGGLPLILPQYSFLWVPDLTLWMVGSVGVFTILLAIFLITIRKAAYIQLFDTHLRLATPFLRLNISYRRLRQTTSTELGRLFPLRKFRGTKRAILKPIAKQMAIVLELNGWPLPPSSLRFFLSPFFFPDNTPRLALVVLDWLKFSTELESLRSAWQDSLRQPIHTPQANLLASLSKTRQ